MNLPVITPSPRKVIIKNNQSPGDIVALAYAIKSLHESNPGRFITDVRTSSPDIFIGNPYIKPLIEGEMINAEYPSINHSNQFPVQYITSFASDLSAKLNVPISPTRNYSSIFMTVQEMKASSIISEMLGCEVPFFVIDAGHKADFTAKAWSFDRYQQVVDRFPDIWFVQVGLKTHIHPELKGKNLINLVGHTSTRELINLVYHSYCVITPVSFPMVLAYSIPPHPKYKRGSRGCVVIAGGREPNVWQQGSNQQFIHTCGMLSCCSQGGCWKSRVVPLNDGDEKDNSLCSFPVEVNNQWIPKCMEMISVDDVCNVIKKYVDNMDYPKGDAKLKEFDDVCEFENGICKRHKFAHNGELYKVSQNRDYHGWLVRKKWDQIKNKPCNCKKSGDLH